MQQVKKYAHRFEIVCWFIIAFVIASPIIGWFFGDNLLNSTYGPDIANFDFKKRAFMAFLGLTQSLFIVYGVSICIKIARLFQQGEVFTHRTAQLFAHLRNAALAYGIYSILLQLLVYILFFKVMPLHVMLTLLSASALIYFFFFFFFSILAFIVSKAVTLQRDQDLTV